MTKIIRKSYAFSSKLLQTISKRCIFASCKISKMCKNGREENSKMRGHFDVYLLSKETK